MFTLETCSEEKPYTGGNICLPEEKYCRHWGIFPLILRMIIKFPTSDFSHLRKIMFSYMYLTCRVWIF